VSRKWHRTSSRHPNWRKTITTNMVSKSINSPQLFQLSENPNACAPNPASETRPKTSRARLGLLNQIQDTTVLDMILAS